MSEHYGAGFVAGVAATLWGAAAFVHFYSPSIVVPALVVTGLATVFSMSTLIK